jgi:hypothetical protein
MTPGSLPGRSRRARRIAGRYPGPGSGRPGCHAPAAALGSGHCSMPVRPHSRPQRAGCLSEGVLDPPGERYRAAEPEATRQLRRCQPSRQLQQRQQIGVRLSDDLRPRLEGRAANTRPTRSAVSRWAANLSACAEARSSHCSSSTTQTSGRSPPPLTASRVRPGQPGTGPAPARRSGRTRSAGPHAAAQTHHDPASARSADAAPRRRAPSPTAHPPRAPPGTPRPAR